MVIGRLEFGWRVIDEERVPKATRIAAKLGFQEARRRLDEVGPFDLRWGYPAQQELRGQTLRFRDPERWPAIYLHAGLDPHEAVATAAHEALHVWQFARHRSPPPGCDRDAHGDEVNAQAFAQDVAASLRGLLLGLPA